MQEKRFLLQTVGVAEATAKMPPNSETWPFCRCAGRSLFHAFERPSLHFLSSDPSGTSARYEKSILKLDSLSGDVHFSALGKGGHRLTHRILHSEPWRRGALHPPAGPEPSAPAEPGGRARWG